MNTSLRCVWCCVIAGLSNVTVAAELVDFNRDIRPILADKCYPCHGPDPGARKAELRLDLRNGLLGKHNGIRPFVAGRLDQSEAMRRVQSADPDVRMPPASSNRVLTPRQIALLTQWVKQGAKWKRHWSFVPPKRPPLPRLVEQDRQWIRNGIDPFVVARLRLHGQRPMKQAEPMTLVRRVYLDLVGLSPTPTEADRWASRIAQESDGYEKLVDHLLASPHYGERWGRRWLDLARYADTNGYEKDRPRSIWPYRDWVIDAFNRDLSFDRFSIEQIAGDMLPKPTQAQRIATGFHRNTMLNEEGGIDPLEFRFHAMTDRVATTGITWLGLTLGCAQCHSHKFDPVSQREYYQFMAFMNNADEPDLEIHDPKQMAQQRSNRALAGRLLQKLPESWPGPNPKQTMAEQFEGWLTKQRAKFVHWSHLRPIKAKSNLPLLTIQRDDSIFASGDSTKKDTFNIWLKATDQTTRAIRLEAIPDSRLPAGGPGMTYYEGKKGDFFLTEIEVFADGKRVPIRAASHDYAKNTFGQAVSAKLATDGDVQTGWSIHGRIAERHSAVFQLSKPIEAGKSLRIKMIFCRHFSCALGRFRFSATSQENAMAQTWTTEIEGLLGSQQLSKAQRQTLLEAFLLQSPRLKKQSRRIKQLLKKPTANVSLVLRERPAHHPRPTHIHRRGEYLQPKAKVAAGTPGVLHSLQAGERRNRLGFARWLVDRGNPLTARVVVNRQWAAIFGRGIVTTLGDFGLQGAPPSHPRLLDWLAVEFMENGWSIKRMHRLIVTSATYRQAANSDRSSLLRGVPRKRLEAEIIRDSVLRSSGVLTNRLRGKPVYPPQPPGAGGLAWGPGGWKTSRGSDRYRRSVYIFLKRTAPFAMLSTFDAPSGEACVARRNRSNTALQALTILNDVMFVEAAQLFGGSLVRSPGSDEQRVEAAFRRVLTRSPNATERRLLLAYVKRQRKRIRNGELKATALAGKGANVKERAVWTALARVLFSLDESQTRN